MDWLSAVTARMKQEVSSKPRHEYFCLDLHRYYVTERKKVSGDDGYQKLIYSRLVFEYRDRGESWFDINPVLADAKELRE